MHKQPHPHQVTSTPTKSLTSVEGRSSLLTDALIRLDDHTSNLTRQDHLISLIMLSILIDLREVMLFITHGRIRPHLQVLAQRAHRMQRDLSSPGMRSLV